MISNLGTHFFLNPSHLTLGSGDRLPKGVKKESLEGNRTPPEQWNLAPKFLFLFVNMTEAPTLPHRLVSRGSQFSFHHEYWRGPRTFQLWVSSPSLTHHIYHCIKTRPHCQAFFSVYWVLVQSYPDSPRSPPTDCIVWRGVRINWCTDPDPKKLEGVLNPHWLRGISLPTQHLYYLKFCLHCQVFFFVFFWVLIHSYPDSNWCTDPDPKDLLSSYTYIISHLGGNVKSFLWGSLKYL